MPEKCTLTLNREDVSQILDAVKERLKVWQHTASYLRDESVPLELPVLADCDNAPEADTVVRHYADIIAAIEGQVS